MRTVGSRRAPRIRSARWLRWRTASALLPGSFCPHYADEPGRRPLYQALVGDGFPAGIACDDLAAVHYVGTDVAEVVASDARARAYRVDRGTDGSVTEEALPARRLDG